MARLARLVLPGVPHHVTQRGNRRQTVFFHDEDYRYHLFLINEFATKANTDLIAYGLMSNHINVIFTPNHSDGLRAALGEAHRRQTRYINFRENQRGHFWQERFHSYPMDDAHLQAAIRYVENNPIAAGIAKSPTEWPWSSANAHVSNRADPLIKLSRAPNLADDRADYRAAGLPPDEAAQVDQHLRTGRPLGSDGFINRAEKQLERTLHRQPPGPKPEAQA